MKKSHCDKVAYETKKEANQFIHNARQTGLFKKGKRVAKVSSKVYICDTCGKFHTSTQK